MNDSIVRGKKYIPLAVDLSAKRTWILQDFATPNFGMPERIKGKALEAKVY